MDNGYYLSAIYKLRERISYNEKADDIRRVSELLAIRAKQDPQNVYPFIRLPFSENNSIRKHVSMVNVAAYNPNCSYYFYELESYGKFEGNIL